ncbi:histidine kinase [Microbacterium sp. NE2HP2]|uniref:sensor histidine kinase n=1 Tax=Microbacterium TaxID=33882 RepID=UPI002366568D|nr:MULTISPECIES: histidine kinase [Microbacterium]MDD7944574.1 histidine kinase [Microbacterium plantarum]WHE36891.1 histidine kinase [Microbacterium sp. BDGP8]WRK18135.1 histidine kinase [Microbacterium plantarum]
MNPPREPGLEFDASATRTFFRTRRAALILVAIVSVSTTVQVLATPITAMMAGPVDWPFDISISLLCVILALACVAQASAVLLSDRWPRIAVFATVAVYLLLLGAFDIPNWLIGMYLVVALAQFLLARRVSAGSAVVCLLGVVVAGMGGLFTWAVFYSGDVGTALSFMANEFFRFTAPALGATALGIWWGAQVRQVTLAREQAELARQEHDARVNDARERERARIAQELHDVAGQHLAGLVTLADAAISLAPARPDEAIRLVGEVRNEGRFAAASLAGALSDLHAADAAGPAETTRDLRRAGELVEFWSQRGMPVSFDLNGAVSDLPAVVSTTAYRVLQEALTNAAKHAPGAPVTISVTVTEEELHARVVNQAPGTDSMPVPGLDLGWGLRGMRERVELLRGTLFAGPTPTGGWDVRIAIPIDPIA